MEGGAGGGDQGSSNSTPPFLTKTYEMVDDSLSDYIVSWSANGRSFVVWNPPDFARDLLPKYFKHNNFSSFVRQLNTYGFRKIDPEQWEFGNEEFVRGQRHLLKNIHRRKPIHSHSTSNLINASQLSESEKHEYEEEIEKLQHDKNVLISELQSHNQEKKEYQFKLWSLGESIESVEHRQQNLINFLSQLLQKPGFSLTLLQQTELHNKRRRLSMPNYFYDEDDIKGNQMTSFREIPDSDSLTLANFEIIDKLESSLSFWELLLHGIDQDSGLVDSMGWNASSEDPNINKEPCSPKSHLHSLDLRKIHSSPDVSESTNHEDSPGISTLYLVNNDNRPKLSIDVNSKPAIALDVESEGDQQAAETAKSAIRANTNDGFWEQFLTETPGSAPTQEGQSQRNDTGSSKKNDSKPVEQTKLWWKMNNVDNLTEKMGHLSPAEKT